MEKIITIDENKINIIKLGNIKKLKEKSIHVLIKFIDPKKFDNKTQMIKL